MGGSGGVGVRMAAGGLPLHAGSKEPQVFNDYFKNKRINARVRGCGASSRWAGPSALKERQGLVDPCRTGTDRTFDAQSTVRIVCI